MKTHRWHYTHWSTIRLIVSTFEELQYQKLVAECQDLQIFPPPPTVDEAIRLLRLTEALIVESKRETARNEEKCLTFEFSLRALRYIALRKIVQCALQGDLQPLFFWLKSPILDSPEVLLLLLEDRESGRFGPSPGRKAQRDRWKYYFYKNWRTKIDEEGPDSVVKEMEDFFKRCRSTVNKRVKELENTDDAKRILEIIEIAKAHPETRGQYIDTYCKEFKELFGHGSA